MTGPQCITAMDWPYHPTAKDLRRRWSYFLPVEQERIRRTIRSRAALLRAMRRAPYEEQITIGIRAAAALASIRWTYEGARLRTLGY